MWLHLFSCNFVGKSDKKDNKVLHYIMNNKNKPNTIIKPSQSVVNSRRPKRCNLCKKSFPPDKYVLVSSSRTNIFKIAIAFKIKGKRKIEFFSTELPLKINLLLSIILAKLIFNLKKINSILKDLNPIIGSESKIIHTIPIFPQDQLLPDSLKKNKNLPSQDQPFRGKYRKRNKKSRKGGSKKRRNKRWK